MTQTLTLSADTYRKLAQGAADRGMTIESLLNVVSNLVVLPEEPTEADRLRSRQVDKLFERARSGQLTGKNWMELDSLIEADYEAANARADKLIRSRQRLPRNGHPERVKRTRK